jgi:hypothetical protein
MKMKIYAVRDSKMNAYATPMFLQSDGHAIRSFGDAINQEDKDSLLWKHSEDFDLFALGEYDQETGMFNTGVPKQLALGREVKIQK